MPYLFDTENGFKISNGSSQDPGARRSVPPSPPTTVDNYAFSADIDHYTSASLLPVRPVRLDPFGLFVTGIYPEVFENIFILKMQISS